MPSPFPGMDPYLEGYLWPDVHHRLAAEICRQLAPSLKPHYVARLDIHVIEDSAPEVEVGLLYPDVEVVTSGRGAAVREPPPAWREAGALIAEAAPSADVTPDMAAPLTIPLPQVRLVTVEVRDVARNQLVTCIEILSPINKREPGLTAYRQKHHRLYRAGVHLLEVDLLRRGARVLAHSRIPHVPYLVMLTRAQANVVELWPIKLQDRLPVVPVPLRAPDADVPLNLSLALATIYDEAVYELSIDYSQPPPPPPLSTKDAAWVKALLEQRQKSQVAGAPAC